MPPEDCQPEDNAPQGLAKTVKLLSGELYLKTVLDSFPSPVLIVDRNLSILDANPAAEKLFQTQKNYLNTFLCGELLNCINAKLPGGGCGKTDNCSHCLLRKIASTLSDGEEAFRILSEMILLKDDVPTNYYFLVSGSLFKYNGNEFVILTLEDISELVELRKIIPICSHCRKVRDDEDYWQNVEEYLGKHTGLKFSHGICPNCLNTEYSDFFPKSKGTDHGNEDGKKKGGK